MIDDDKLAAEPVMETPKPPAKESLWLRIGNCEKPGRFRVVAEVDSATDHVVYDSVNECDGNISYHVNLTWVLAGLKARDEQLLKQAPEFDDKYEEAAKQDYEKNRHQLLGKNGVGLYVIGRFHEHEQSRLREAALLLEYDEYRMWAEGFRDQLRKERDAALAEVERLKVWLDEMTEERDERVKTLHAENAELRLNQPFAGSTDTLNEKYRLKRELAEARVKRTRLFNLARSWKNTVKSIMKDELTAERERAAKLVAALEEWTHPPYVDSDLRSLFVTLNKRMKYLIAEYKDGK